jgi:hypothetical protein
MFVRIAAMAAVLAGASVGLAGLAAQNRLRGPTRRKLSATTVHREFHLQGNTWTSSSDPKGDGIVCTTTIDSGSLTGSTGCGFITFPLKLTKVG